MEETPQYWFRAKRYGWGWGLPSSPGGWVFFLIWLLVLGTGIYRLRPLHALAPPLFVGLMVLVLVAVCYWKGEPPSWRWGDRN